MRTDGQTNSHDEAKVNSCFLKILGTRLETPTSNAIRLLQNTKFYVSILTIHTFTYYTLTPDLTLGSLERSLWRHIC